MVLIYLITKDAQEAKNIGTKLIEERLANSANVIPAIQTMRWSVDQVLDVKETVLLIKAKSLLYSKIEKRVSEIMNIDTPNIFSMPMTLATSGLPEFFKRRSPGLTNLNSIHS